jgi:hypothetical protein
MKRYRPEADGVFMGAMVEDGRGAWVRRVDAEREMAGLRAMLKAARGFLRNRSMQPTLRQWQEDVDKILEGK